MLRLLRQHQSFATSIVRGRVRGSLPYPYSAEVQNTKIRAAISAGIFWGVIGVLTLIFVLWLFSPLLIPLAFAAQIYVIERWRDLLVILSLGAIMGMVIVGLWFWLVNSSLAIWFEKRDSWPLLSR